METMMAIRLQDYGGPESLVYESAPRPTPGDHEILVRVRAAGVNPVDWKFCAGWMRERLLVDLPVVPGLDLSGTVVAVGRLARNWRVGDEVFGRTSLGGHGAFAEYAVAPADAFARKPPHLDHVHAAAIPTAGLTAWQALFGQEGANRGLEPAPGRRILVHGGAGGVGSFAVQLAKWKGAQVLVTGRAENGPFLRGLGADVVIDRESARFEDIAGVVDAVLDLVGGETLDRSLQVLSRGGAIASAVGSPSVEQAAERGVRIVPLWARTVPAQLERLATLVGDKVLRVVVSEVLPLAHARRALELSRGGQVRGKLVLEIGG
ncbi:MAG: NADP-dependent oxidoreductase [Deltaproteobacteria bacterium]|nr:NADP-dependent oxidoreductase [Deltaproteobacteria bacterium]